MSTIADLRARLEADGLGNKTVDNTCRRFKNWLSTGRTVQDLMSATEEDIERYLAESPRSPASTNTVRYMIRLARGALTGGSSSIHPPVDPMLALESHIEMLDSTVQEMGKAVAKMDRALRRDVAGMRALMSARLAEVVDVVESWLDDGDSARAGESHYISQLKAVIEGLGEPRTAELLGIGVAALRRRASGAVKPRQDHLISRLYVLVQGRAWALNDIDYDDLVAMDPAEILETLRLAEKVLKDDGGEDE